MKTEVSIRSFVFPDDYESVYRLWENAGDGIHLRQSDSLDEIAKKQHRDPDLFLVAEVKNEVIGSVLGGFDGRRGMMYHLVVSSAFRKQGIGDLLVRNLEERLKEKGCIRYYLLVTKDNSVAINFYEKRGFDLLDLYVYGKDIG